MGPFQSGLARLMSCIMEYYRSYGWSLSSAVLKAEMNVLYVLYGMLFNACQQIDRLYHILGTSEYLAACRLFGISFVLVLLNRDHEIVTPLLLMSIML